MAVAIIAPERLSSVTQEASFCSRWQLQLPQRQLLPICQCAENKRLWSAQL